jgi:hypothetical protein
MSQFFTKGQYPLRREEMEQAAENAFRVADIILKASGVKIENAKKT